MTSVKSIVPTIESGKQPSFESGRMSQVSSLGTGIEGDPTNPSATADHQTEESIVDRWVEAMENSLVQISQSETDVEAIITSACASLCRKHNALGSDSESEWPKVATSAKELSLSVQSLREGVEGLSTKAGDLALSRHLKDVATSLSNFASSIDGSGDGVSAVTHTGANTCTPVMAEMVTAAVKIGAAVKCGPELRLLIQPAVEWLKEADRLASRLHKLKVKFETKPTSTEFLAWRMAAYGESVEILKEIETALAERNRGCTKDPLFEVGRVGNIEMGLGMILRILRQWNDYIEFDNVEKEDDLSWLEILAEASEEAEQVEKDVAQYLAMLWPGMETYRAGEKAPSVAFQETMGGQT